MRHSFDFLYRCQKHQNLSRWFFSIDINNGLEHLEKIVLRRFFEVMNGDLMQPTCYIDRFYAQFPPLTLVIPIQAEKPTNSLIIDGRRRDDQFQILSSLHDAFEEAEEHIIIDGPFVNIIQNDDGVLFEKRTTVQLLNQCAISHKHDSSIAIHRGIEPHLMRYLEVITPQLLCHSLP